MTTPVHTLRFPSRAHLDLLTKIADERNQSRNDLLLELLDLYFGDRFEDAGLSNMSNHVNVGTK